MDMDNIVCIGEFISLFSEKLKQPKVIDLISTKTTKFAHMCINCMHIRVVY